MTSKMSTADLIKNVMFMFIENTSITCCFSYNIDSDEDSN